MELSRETVLEQIIGQIIIWALPVLVAVVFHEVAHGWVAYRLGDPTAAQLGRLTLNPFAHVDLFGTILVPLMLIVANSPFVFGYAKPVPVNFNNLRNPKRDMIWVAVAGPVTNLLLAAGCAVIWRLTVPLTGAQGAPYSLSSLVDFFAPVVLMAQSGILINITAGRAIAGTAGLFGFQSRAFRFYHPDRAAYDPDIGSHHRSADGISVETLPGNLLN
jgi:Zn-dependent protease